MVIGLQYNSTLQYSAYKRLFHKTKPNKRRKERLALVEFLTSTLLTKGGGGT